VPQIVSCKAYGKEVDWWCLGVILFEMLKGSVLFGGDSEAELFDAILHKPIPWPATISAEAKTVRRLGAA
jgi:serine/threonine protein kinase